MPAAQRWIYSIGRGLGAVLHRQHAGRPPRAEALCGRVVFSDIHVSAPNRLQARTVPQPVRAARRGSVAAGAGAGVHALRPVVLHSGGEGPARHPVGGDSRRSPLPTYARDGGLRQAPVMPHSRSAASEKRGSGGSASPGSCRTVIGHDEACSGDRWRRSDGADVGGRARAGAGRRRHRRAARQPGPRRLARRRSAFTHHRGARSAWHRGSLPLARARSCRSRASR